MKNKVNILFIISITFISCNCGLHLAQNFIGGWTEKPIGFINSIPHAESKSKYVELLMEFKWIGIGVQSFYQNNSKPFNWIKNPKNILTAHNTIKKIGYKKFISVSEYHKSMKFQDMYGGMQKLDWEGMSLSQIVDSLILTYDKTKSNSNYFHKFWKRRKTEGTDISLISILTDIKSIYEKQNVLSSEKSFNTNDTLENLLRFDLRLQEFNQNPTKEFLLSYFDYLKSIGLNQSAYNLVIEKFPGQIQLDTVVKILNLHTISDAEYWQTRNNGTWIYTYKGNGP